MTNLNDMQALVKTIIEAQVIQALNDAPEAIEKLVKAALSQPVDSVGDHKGYNTKMPYLDWLVGDEIRIATRAAVKKVVADSADKIEAEVRKGLNSETIVAAMVKAISNAAGQDWRIDVKFETERSR